MDDTNKCYLVCYIYGAGWETTMGLYDIFYSRPMSEKYYKNKLDELRSTASFDSSESIALIEIPINALDRTGLEEYKGRRASKELKKILEDMYPVLILEQDCLEKKYYGW